MKINTSSKHKTELTLTPRRIALALVAFFTLFLQVPSAVPSSNDAASKLNIMSQLEVYSSDNFPLKIISCAFIEKKQELPCYIENKSQVRIIRAEAILFILNSSNEIERSELLVFDENDLASQISMATLSFDTVIGKYERSILLLKRVFSERGVWSLADSRFQEEAKSKENLPLDFTAAVVYEKNLELSDYEKKHLLKTSFLEFLQDGEFRDQFEANASRLLILSNGFIKTLSVESKNIAFITDNDITRLLREHGRVDFFKFTQFNTEGHQVIVSLAYLKLNKSIGSPCCGSMTFTFHYDADNWQLVNKSIRHI